MKIIEQKNIGSFDYIRHDLGESNLAHQKMGVVRPTGETGPARATLYLFHAATGDDTQPVADGFFASLDPKTVEAIKETGLQIILPYIGPSFLHEVGGVNYADHFFDEIMRAAEGISPISPAKRLIAGVSMGGFAALRAFFQSPQLFAGVGTLAPSLFDLDCFDANAVSAYTQKSGAVEGYVAHMMSGVRAVFRDNDDFRSASPNALAEQVPYSNLRGRSIYLNVGDQDEFGLSEGVSALSGTLFSRDISHEKVIVSGAKHDMVYANQQFPSLMQALLRALS